MTVTERAKRQAERRAPGWWWWAAGTVVLAGRCVRWLAVHLAFTGAALLAGLTWWAVAAGWWPWLAGATGVIFLGLGAATEARPDGWARLHARVVARRRRRRYLQLWDDAMDGAGLVRAQMVPQLLSVHVTGASRNGHGGPYDLDVLQVAMAAGQLVSDWRAVQPRLVSAFADLGVRRLRCHPVSDRPDLVELYAGHRRPVQRIGYAGPGNNAVTKPEQDEGTGNAMDEAGQQPRQDAGPFPRTPRGET